MILRWIKNRVTKKKTKPKPKLKQRLDIIQDANTLRIAGAFRREDFTAKQLWLFSRDEEVKKHQIAEITPSNSFNFEVPLEKLTDLLKENDGETFDWYFKVRTLYDSITHSRKESDDLKLVEENDVLYVEYFIRLGRFQETRIEGLEFYTQDDFSLINYISTKGNLSIIVNAEPDSPIRLQIDKAKKRNQTLRLEGKIFSRNSIIQDGEIVLVGRDTDHHLTSSEITFHKLQEQVEKKYGLNRYTYVANINLKDMNQGRVLDRSEEYTS